MTQFNTVRIEAGDCGEKFLFAAIDENGLCVDYVYKTGDLELCWDDLHADGDAWGREWHLLGTGCSILGSVDRIHASMIDSSRFSGYEPLFVLVDED